MFQRCALRSVLVLLLASATVQAGWQSKSAKVTFVAPSKSSIWLSDCSSGSCEYAVRVRNADHLPEDAQLGLFASGTFGSRLIISEPLPGLFGQAETFSVAESFGPSIATLKEGKYFLAVFRRRRWLGNQFLAKSNKVLVLKAGPAAIHKDRQFLRQVSISGSAQNAQVRYRLRMELLKKHMMTLVLRSLSNGKILAKKVVRGPVKQQFAGVFQEQLKAKKASVQGPVFLEVYGKAGAWGKTRLLYRVGASQEDDNEIAAEKELPLSEEQELLLKDCLCHGQETCRCNTAAIQRLENGCTCDGSNPDCACMKECCICLERNGFEPCACTWKHFEKQLQAKGALQCSGVNEDLQLLDDVNQLAQKEQVDEREEEQVLLEKQQEFALSPLPGCECKGRKCACRDKMQAVKAAPCECKGPFDLDCPCLTAQQCKCWSDKHGWRPCKCTLDHFQYSRYRNQLIN